MKFVLTQCWVLLVLVASIAQAQTKPAAKATATAKVVRRPLVTAQEVQELKDALAAQGQRIEQQQRQIQSLTDEMHKRDAELQQAKQEVQKLEATTTAAVSQSTQDQQTVSTLQTEVNDLKQNQTNAALSLQETQKNIQSSLENPLALHYKGITITPGGFLAAETVWRSHALGADINTPFNSIPFDGATASHLSEFYGSGRQSRVSMLAEGKLNAAKLTGYVEADFLSAGITSNNNQSNSYSLRQRQAWAQAALNSGWSFTGGQMWSLVTETKSGVDNRSEALPMTIDAQYNVGFSWARQYGFRLAKNFNNRVWWAASLENSQTTLGGHLAPGQNNFIIGAQGASGGLYNATSNYSFNASPDLVTKLVFQPGWGHYEVLGLFSDFRDRVFPCGGAISATNGVLPPPVPCGTGNIPNASGAFTKNKIGGGVGINIRGTVAHQLDVGIHALAGDGIGRYGSAGLADVVVRPDGVLVPVRNYQALGTVEYHSKRLDVYLNVGAEYEARAAYTFGGKGAGYGSSLFNNSGCYNEAPPSSTVINVDTPVSSTSTNPVGSGTVPNPGSAGTPLSAGFNPAGPSNCTGDTRSIWEGTIGFWYRFYNGPKGRLQWGPQYSYIDRNTWSGTGGNPATGNLLANPNATENMFLTSFRYYLP
ncbi:MAG: hypothetical protein JOZ80_01720 [Acidobacteriaceae bacterium]|nr:hypothetical protein [Acidobacteriaceae bacterium]